MNIMDLDLIEIESLRKWIEYKPKCYLDKMQDDNNIKMNEELDETILMAINQLYGLIEKIDGKIDLSNQHYYLDNSCSFEDKNMYWQLVRVISKLDINYYVNLKLTDEERQVAYDFIKKCTIDNKDEMRKYAMEENNFYIGSYMISLLDDYIFGRIDESLKKSSIRLDKRFKEINIKEKDRWEYSNRRRR